MPTIYAVSSGRPPAGVAVIRISGPRALAAATTLAGSLPLPREARVRSLRDPTGALLDRALVLVFPGPHSATGEDLAELHCHGGRAVTDAVMRALAATPGLRVAEPGEFTRRALANGRIDLAEAQGLADLLAAETERQRVAALAAAEGRVSRAIRGWLDRIAILSAEVEASLDFADEEDVGDDDLSAVREGMAELAAAIAAVLDAPATEALRDGIRVVIAGAPNTGKSTLINLLADRDVAIVSPIAGTTRDRVDAHVVHDGLPFILTDTAGLTETDDVVERIGVERAERAIERADIVVWMDDSAPPDGALWLFPRADMEERRGLPSDGRLAVARSDAASVSAVWRALANRAERLVPREDEIALAQAQRERCREAVEALAINPMIDGLIVAEHLRAAAKSLATILGIDATEAMLDALFGRFCIGK